MLKAWKYDAEKAVGRPNAPPPVQARVFGLQPIQWSAPGSYDPKVAAANSVVQACIQWLHAEIAGLKVAMAEERRNQDGNVETVLIDSHPFLDILECPNSRDTWDGFLDQILRAAFVAGQAPIEVLRDDGFGFQYVTWDGLRKTGGVYLTADQRRIAEEDLAVLVWRRNEAGTAPESPLVSLNKFIRTDEATIDSTYGRMKSPYIGALITQGPDAPPLTPSQQKTLEDDVKRFEGDGAGGTSILNVPGLNVTELRGPANDIANNNVHATAEERICAIFRIPPSVVQMGTGLEQTTENATLMEETRMAWKNGVMPLLRRLERWLTLQLYAQYEPDSPLRVAFDTTGVEFLSEDERRDRHERLRDDVDAGILTREQAFTLGGYEFEGLEFEAEEPEPEPAPQFLPQPPPNDAEE